MQATEQHLDAVLIAPEQIIAATRADFRAAALAHLASLPSNASAMVIDLGNTSEIDASGLGILVLIQKRAKERGLSTRLRRTPDRVHNLLKLTMLDFLFEMMD
jgi:anti-anti-sigma factor